MGTQPFDRAIGRAIGRDKPIDVPSGLRLHRFCPEVFRFWVTLPIS